MTTATNQHTITNISCYQFAELTELNDRISQINSQMVRDLEAAAKVQR